MKSDKKKRSGEPGLKCFQFWEQPNTKTFENARTPILFLKLQKATPRFQDYTCCFENSSTYPLTDPLGTWGV